MNGGRLDPIPRSRRSGGGRKGRALGASATRGRRRMRRGSAAWCGLPQSPPGDRGTSGGEPSPSAIRFLPAGASTDGDGDLSPRLLLVWERTRFSWWLGAACLDGVTGERKYPWSQTPVPAGPDFLGQGEGQGQGHEYFVQYFFLMPTCAMFRGWEE